MKRKYLIGFIALSLTLMPAAAQNQSHQAAEVNPGLIGAGSPIYGLEVAYDNAAMNIGLKKAGEVAQERAAEARQAAQNNNTRGMQRAAQELQTVANRTDVNDQGLNRAMQIMQETIQNAPNEQARQGMRTALENMQQAQQRRQEARNRAGQNGERPEQEQQRDGADQANRTDRQQERQQDRDRNTTTDTDTTSDTNTTSGSEDRNTTPGR